MAPPAEKVTFVELSAALVVTGAGEKAFVAGADIAEMQHMATGQAEAFARLGGKLADVIVVGANPLEDINNVRQLQLVLKEGRVVSDKRPKINSANSA